MDRVDGQLVADLLSVLDPRGRSAVRLYYGLDGVEGRTFADVARLLGLTPDATRATVRSSLSKLRQMSGDDLGVA
jgi:DNA-directed RNA polymerase sigma subunit (sigma70/sigma32)